MLNKSDMDLRIANTLGIPARKVAVITDAFIDEMNNAVANHGGFHLVGFGKLRLAVGKGSTNLNEEKRSEPLRARLYFSKSKNLKRQIERSQGIRVEVDMGSSDEGMSKYAVDEGIDPEVLEKAATQGCPQCGAPVQTHGRITVCPKCGTEPFEK